MSTPFVLKHPEGICLGRSGSLWLCDSELGQILQIAADGRDGRIVRTIGASASEARPDGPVAGQTSGQTALGRLRLDAPCALVLSADEQRIFVVDRRALAVWRIDLAADVAHLLACGPAAGISQVHPRVGDTMPALGALASAPRSVAVDEEAGCVYLAMTDNQQLWRLDLPEDPTQGQVAVLAGATHAATGNVDVHDDIRAEYTFATARFSAPGGLALAPDRKRLYVADSGHRAVRILHLDDARVTTLINHSDGLSGCTQVAIGPGGLLVVDADGDAIYGVNPRHRTLVQLVWTGEVQLSRPTGMVFDRDHYGYVIADTDNRRLVRLMRDMSAATQMALSR